MNLRYLYNLTKAGILKFEGTPRGPFFTFQQNNTEINPFNRNGKYMVFISGIYPD